MSCCEARMMRLKVCNEGKKWSKEKRRRRGREREREERRREGITGPRLNISGATQLEGWGGGGGGGGDKQASPKQRPIVVAQVPIELHRSH